MAITASEARTRLFPLIDEINDSDEVVEIVSRRGRAYLVPAAYFESMEETVHLLSSPRNGVRLLESFAAVKRGEYEYHDLIDPDIYVHDEASE